MIIGAVAGLGAGLDKRVVAEGIETEEQMRQVKAHGCHEGQGHFFGEPMPLKSSARGLQNRRASHSWLLDSAILGANPQLRGDRRRPIFKNIACFPAYDYSC